MKLALIGLLVIGAAQVGFSAERSEPIQPIEPAVVTNPAKVELGKKLFFDPRLSKSGSISCNSCHNLSTGGVDGLPSSIGHGWAIGPINSPTVLNSKYNLAQFWDGRAKDLKEQAGGPIANPGEMASTHDLAISIINSIPGYQTEFAKVYKKELATIDLVTDAIAAFEETLVTPNSRFDQWLKGNDSAMTAHELQGYQTFKEKGCVSCHNGPAVGGNSYQKFGLVKPYTDDTKTLGRYNVTKKEEDKFVFKVPTLRNIELTAPYFHNAATWSLQEAIKIMGEHQLGLPINDKEADAIAAFLKTLTGDQPKVELPILPPSVPKTPRPNLAITQDPATRG